MANGTKAPKGWLIAALVSLLLGLGGCGTAVATAASFVGDIADNLNTTQYGDTASFRSGGASGALVLATHSTATCTVEDDDGRVITLDGLGGNTEVESDGLQGIGTFETRANTTYLVTCTGPGSTGEFAVINFDLNKILIATFAGLAGGFMLVLAIIFFIVGLVRRSSWKKKQRMGGGGGGYGGGPAYPPVPGQAGYPTPGYPGQAPQPPQAPGGYAPPPGPGSYSPPPAPGGYPGQTPPPPLPGDQNPPPQGGSPWG